MKRFSKYFFCALIAGSAFSLSSCKSSSLVGTYNFYVDGIKAEELVIRANNTFSFIAYNAELLKYYDDMNSSGTWRNVVDLSTNEDKTIVVLNYFSRRLNKNTSVEYIVDYPHHVLLERYDYNSFGYQRIFSK